MTPYSYALLCNTDWNDQKANPQCILFQSEADDAVERAYELLIEEFVPEAPTGAVYSLCYQAQNVRVVRLDDQVTTLLTQDGVRFPALFEEVRQRMRAAFEARQAERRLMADASAKEMRRRTYLELKAEFEGEDK